MSALALTLALSTPSAAQERGQDRATPSPPTQTSSPPPVAYSYPNGSPLRVDAIIVPGVRVGRLRLRARQSTVTDTIGVRPTNADDPARPLDKGEWYYGEYAPNAYGNRYATPAFSPLHLHVSFYDGEAERITGQVQEITSRVRGQRLVSSSGPRIGDDAKSFIRRMLRAHKPTDGGCGYNRCIVYKVVKVGTRYEVRTMRLTITQIPVSDGSSTQIVDEVRTSAAFACKPRDRGERGCTQYQEGFRGSRGGRGR